MENNVLKRSPAAILKRLRNLTVQELIACSRSTRISVRTLYRLRGGECDPRLSQLVKLQEHFAK
jgi:predicted transcriptional regulator